MRLLRSLGGWGVVVLGVLVMLIGHIFSLSEPFHVGKYMSNVLGPQLEQVGFMLIAAGFVACFIMYVLTELKII